MFTFYHTVLLFDFSRSAFSHLTHNVLALAWKRNQTERINVPKEQTNKQPTINQQTKSFSHQYKKEKRSEKKGSVYHSNSKAQNTFQKQVLAL